MNNSIVEIIKLQRKKVIIVATSGIVLGIIINLVGITGHQGPLFRTIVIGYLVTILTVTCINFFKKVPTRAIVIALLISAEMTMCCESIIYAYYNTPYSTLIIVVNMSILAIVVLVSNLAYIQYITYALALTTIVTYIFCAYISNNENLWSLLLFFTIIYSVTAALSSMMRKSVSSIIQENLKLKIDVQEVLKNIGLSEVQFKSIIASSHNKVGDIKTLNIFDIISDTHRENLKNNLAYIMEQENIEYDKINDTIPEFTPSEIEIAKLILEGKKLGDITVILNKKRSNITCQRSRMRNKLNLNEEDNLREAIIKRINTMT